MMNVTLTDLVGMIGAVILIVAFFLLQVGRISANALTYSVLNAVGATLICFSLLFNFNLSAFVIELFWIGISLLGIFKIVRERNHTA